MTIQNSLHNANGYSRIAELGNTIMQAELVPLQFPPGTTLTLITHLSLMNTGCQSLVEVYFSYFGYLHIVASLYLCNRSLNITCSILCF